MKINSKRKTIIISPKDDRYEILLAHPNTDELMNVRVIYTSKGFGLEIFSERMKDLPKKPLSVFFEGDNYREEEYVGIWKFTPSVKRRVRKKYR
jgi:hypothetical protein